MIEEQNETKTAVEGYVPDTIKEIETVKESVLESEIKTGE